MSERKPTQEDFTSLAEIFKLIGDPVRLQLFFMLCHRELNLSMISTEMGMTPQALSHHVKLLKDADLITGRRSGKEVFYRACDTKKVHYLHSVAEGLMEMSCPGFAQDR